MPPCTYELRPTQPRRLDLTMECELEDRLGSDVETFRMRQPSNWDRSERRICTIDQYVINPLLIPPSLCTMSIAHKQIWLMANGNPPWNYQAKGLARRRQLYTYTLHIHPLRTWSMSI